MENDEGDETERSPPRCGWYCWRPNFLQPCYKWPLGLVTMCCFAFMEGFIVHGISMVNSTSLERRFKLSGFQIGWFNAANDLAGAVSTIFFSYMADHQNRPRWLMIAAIFYSVGCFVMSLPHYIAEPYDGRIDNRESLCGSNLMAQNQTEEECSLGIGVSSWLGVLILGNVITGIGAGMIFTIGIPFIDDFSDAASVSFHISLAWSSAALGASSAFALGAAILRLNVNFNRPDWPQFTGNQDLSPHYVGAWWLGWVLGAAGCGLVAFMFSCFDYEMVETAELRKKRTAETHEVNVNIGRDVSGKPRFWQVVVQFFGSVIKLCCNPVLVLVTIGFIAHGLMAEGISPFLVKLLRTQFAISETKTAFATAVIFFCAVGGAFFSSGLLLQCGNFSLRSLILVTLIAEILGMLSGFGFLLHCPEEKISGITIKYDDFSNYDPIPTYDTSRLTHDSCNNQCKCSPSLYEPVCHQKLGIQFFSPCYGGCTSHQTELTNGVNNSLYLDCSCLAPLFADQQNLSATQKRRFQDTLNSLPSPAGTTATNTSPHLAAYRNFSINNVLESGPCDMSCKKFYGAVVFIFLTLYFAYFIVVPLSRIVIRCVPDENRSLALAFHHALEKCLGAVPGPIMIGSVIDAVCLFRESTKCSGDKGACYAYDVPMLAERMVGIFVGLHCVAVTCYVIAFLVYKAPNGETVKDYFHQRMKKRETEEEMSPTPSE